MHPAVKIRVPTDGQQRDRMTHQSQKNISVAEEKRVMRA